LHSKAAKSFVVSILKQQESFGFCILKQQKIHILHSKAARKFRILNLALSKQQESLGF